MNRKERKEIYIDPQEVRHPEKIFEEKVPGEDSENIEECLVGRYIYLKQKIDRLKLLLERKQDELYFIENELVQLLEDENKKSSAKFKGVGHVTLKDPHIARAFIIDGQQDVVFDYLKSIDREDMIKTYVHPALLKSLIKEKMEEGNIQVPGVGYTFKQTLLAYPWEKKGE